MDRTSVTAPNIVLRRDWASQEYSNTSGFASIRLIADMSRPSMTSPIRRKSNREMIPTMLHVMFAVEKAFIAVI